MPMVDIDWLKDHVEVPEGLTYEQLAKDLVKVGLEEEEIHTSQVTGPIVVGYVVDATPEPQKNGKIINWRRAARRFQDRTAQDLRPHLQRHVRLRA